jgi:STE24 endopeptidase
VLALVVYIVLVFGYLSRRCERQADVYACRAVSCADPGCAGHDEATVYPERAAGLCPTGIRTCARALNRVDDVNGGSGGGPTRGGWLRGFFRWLRTWSHGPMPRRVEFVLGLIDDPRAERRFQRRVAALRWGLLLALAATLVGLGGAVGWRQLLEAM